MKKEPNINYRQFLTDTSVLSVKVKIVGVGGGGINTVNNLIDFKLKGVQFIAVNTDFKSLETSKAPTKLFIGEKITKGKSSNGNPLIGRGAAFQSVGVIKKTFIDSHMVFITAGLGGGTGTGAAPVIAKICKNIGAQVIAIVSTPFSFEGDKRNKQAAEGMLALNKIVDTIIVKPNDRIRERTTKDETILNMFKKADGNIYHLIKNIIEKPETIFSPTQVFLKSSEEKTFNL
jgi:cell division protein FtsZ